MEIPKSAATSITESSSGSASKDLIWNDAVISAVATTAVAVLAVIQGNGLA